MMVNVDTYFLYDPTCRRTTMIPRHEYKEHLNLCFGKTKYEAEHSAMLELWNKRHKLNLGINHRFQITGNFTKELNGL